MKSRRGLEILVLAFGALFLAVVVYSFRPGRRPASSRASDAAPRPPPGQEAGQPMTVSKGFDYTETVGGKPIFRIQSERTVGFGPAAGLVPNVYSLEQVVLTLYPESGAPVTVGSGGAAGTARRLCISARSSWAAGTSRIRRMVRPPRSARVQTRIRPSSSTAKPPSACMCRRKRN